MGDTGKREIRSVMVVDDDERQLAMCQLALRRHGKQPTVAANPITARYLARQQRPDLAIVDLRLGASSGIDLIRELKQDDPALRVVLISGWMTLVSAMAAVRAGAELFLAKPVTPRQILEYLETDTVPEVKLDDTPSLDRVEYEHIHRVLAESDGNIAEAARRLRIYRQSLARKLRKTAPKA